MKTKFYIVLSAIILNCTISEIIPQKMGDAYRLFINNINLPLNRAGVLADVNIPDPDPIISGEGGKLDGKVFLFSGGFFLSGLANGELWANAVASATLVQDYRPGLNGFPNDFRAQIYRLRRNDPPFSNSWYDWMDAVALGANFYDGNGDGVYFPVDANGNGKWDLDEDRPDILGDETLWCVYHDGVPSSQRRWNTVLPKGIEIRQTTFAYSGYPSLRNAIFIRYEILNTGAVGSIMDDVYFSVWDDPDLGDSQDDLIGCDINLSSLYTYNDGNDPIFGTNPPTFLVKLLAGPHSYIPGITFIDINSNGIYEEGIDTPLDTASYKKGQVLGVKKYPGAKNLAPSSMINYQNGDPNLFDPTTAQEARNYMLGFTRTGSSIDPCTWSYGSVYGGVNCNTLNNKFWYSGDPTTSFGWINTVPRDMRQLLNVGPFKLETDKPVEVFAVYSTGRESNALNSIALAKNIAAKSFEFFSSNFDTNAVVSVTDNLNSNLPNTFALFQNYPNPFNPSTTIRYAIPLLGGARGGSQLVQLKVYDMLGREVVTLVNEEKEPGIYRAEFNTQDYQLASGIYLYRLQAGNYVETKKMVLMK